jgi:hypothetical protein
MTVKGDSDAEADGNGEADGTEAMDVDDRVEVEGTVGSKSHGDGLGNVEIKDDDHKEGLLSEKTLEEMQRRKGRLWTCIVVHEPPCSCPAFLAQTSAITSSTVKYPRPSNQYEKTFPTYSTRPVNQRLPTVSRPRTIRKRRQAAPTRIRQPLRHSPRPVLCLLRQSYHRCDRIFRLT